MQRVATKHAQHEARSKLGSWQGRVGDGRSSGWREGGRGTGGTRTCNDLQAGQRKVPLPSIANRASSRAHQQQLCSSRLRGVCHRALACCRGSCGWQARGPTCGRVSLPHHVSHHSHSLGRLKMGTPCCRHAGGGWDLRADLAPEAGRLLSQASPHARGHYAKQRSAAATPVDCKPGSTAKHPGAQVLQTQLVQPGAGARSVQQWRRPPLAPA